MHHHHRQAEQPAEQRERVEQAEDRSLVGQPQGGIKLERHPLKEIAKNDAENERRHDAAGEQAPIPESPPALVAQLVAVLEADRAKDESEEEHQHRRIEGRK